MRPSGESLDIGIGHTRAPLDHPILGQRHLQQAEIERIPGAG
jgi:hypothetical protein